MSKEKITFIIPVCSRGRRWQSIDECPLIATHLKSVVATILPDEYEKFDFHCAFGYDHDDAFFLDLNNLTRIFQRFDETNITVSNHCFNDTQHNPVRAWNNLAEIAVNDLNTDYLYQSGDDVELLTPGWATKFTDALKANGNVGVSAPVDQGYYSLYTQSFVHRKHVEIMGQYYPDDYRSWYCDDHMTGVYKPIYNNYIEDCKIKNTGGPQRYNAHDAQPVLPETVATGMVKLARYLVTQDPEFDLKSYYDQTQTTHARYQEISKTMTTAPAKPFWSTACKIYEGIWVQEFGELPS